MTQRERRQYKISAVSLDGNPFTLWAKSAENAVAIAQTLVNGTVGTISIEKVQ